MVVLRVAGLVSEPPRLLNALAMPTAQRWLQSNLSMALTAKPLTDLSLQLPNRKATASDSRLCTGLISISGERYALLASSATTRRITVLSGAM